MEKTKQQGFTLIELMVTIAIVAILASIAVPAFRTMIVNNRIEATANRLRNTFIAARNKSIELEQATTVTAAEIAAVASVLVDVVDDVDVEYVADGSIVSPDLAHVVFSICQEGSVAGVRNKAVVVFPSGLVVVKGEKQMVTGDAQLLNCL